MCSMITEPCGMIIVDSQKKFNRDGNTASVGGGEGGRAIGLYGAQAQRG